MRSVLLLLLTLFLVVQSVLAQNVKVKALSDFSTESPPKIWQVEIVDGFETKDGIPFYSGSVITGKIVSIKQPKRMKRNAQFTFIPTKYYDSISKRTTDIDTKVKGKYSPTSDATAGKILKKSVVIVSSKLISGFISPGVALIEGLVKNEEGNRAKSAAKSVYESTPISYLEKGKELVIRENQVFIMNFKLAKEDEQEDISIIEATENNTFDNEGTLNDNAMEELF
jgi:hypothetical protein